VGLAGKTSAVEAKPLPASDDLPQIGWHTFVSFKVPGKRVGGQVFRSVAVKAVAAGDDAPDLVCMLVDALARWVSAS
jgi:hypothetical protein